MFERISRSWELVKASFSVLSKDKELMFFPLMSTIALIGVTLGFALPALGLGALDGLAGGESGAISGLMFVGAFLFYFCQYTVMFFFNTALVGAAMIRLDGGDPTFKDGMNIATSKLGTILGYAAIAATVGMILRMIQERFEIVGRIIVAIIGTGWNIATFLVVPVLATRDVGPIDAVKESALLLKKTWGENIIGQAGIGLAFGFIHVAIVAVGIVLAILAAMSGSMILVGIVVLTAVLAVVTAALVQTALAGIYSAALYRYATTGEAGFGFETGALKLAFAPK